MERLYLQKSYVNSATPKTQKLKIIPRLNELPGDDGENIYGFADFYHKKVQSLGKWCLKTVAFFFVGYGKLRISR